MREIRFRAWDEKSNKYWMPGGKNWLNVYDDIGCCASLGCFDVIEQYTGLKDKNEKEIYEGDILEFDHTLLGAGSKKVVSFDKGSFMVGIIEIGISSIRNMFVIGNIHEDKELLNAAL